MPKPTKRKPVIFVTDKESVIVGLLSLAPAKGKPKEKPPPAK